MAKPRASLAAQAELEAQIEALRYAAQAAEGASERFSALFSSVPLALFVVDEDSLVLECNGRALDLFRPQESDPPLNFLFPLVTHAHLDRVTHALEQARSAGRCDVPGVVFAASPGAAPITGDLHIAHIGNADDDAAVRRDGLAVGAAEGAQVRLVQGLAVIGGVDLAGGVAMQRAVERRNRGHERER